MRILLAGGGTAGHLIPGLVVADELVKRGHDPSSILAVNHRLQSASGRSSGWRKSGDAIVGEGAAGLQ